jgi:signal transduction histidine kinase
MLRTGLIARLPSSSGTPARAIAIIKDEPQREHRSVAVNRQQEVDRLLSLALVTLLQSREPAKEIGKILSPLVHALHLDSYLAYMLSPDRKHLHLTACGGVLPKQQEMLRTRELGEKDLARLSIAGETQASIGSHREMLGSIGLRGVSTFPLLTGDHLIGMLVFGRNGHATIPLSLFPILARVSDYISIALDRAAKENEIHVASQAKDNFLVALSHELRTPLNPILLLSSDAKTNPGFPDEARETFQAIEKNVMLVARLIDDLLDLTRIAHGKNSLEMRSYDIHRIVDSAYASIRSAAADRKLKVQFEFSPGPAPVAGDSGRLQQVFRNILNNSVKFTEIGGSIWVRSHRVSKGTEIAIEISDSGVGMDEAEIARISEAFTQGDHAYKGPRFGGLGLGMAITRTLVAIHSGRIEARSPGKGHGSSFWVYLPLLAPVAPA